MYEIIARDYEKLFPSDPARVEFARRLAGRMTDNVMPAEAKPAGGLPDCGMPAGSAPQSYGAFNILDIGCASGEFALALCAAGFQVTGWEPDSQLLAKARHLRSELTAAQQARLTFERKGMLDLWAQQVYDQIYCMGNTLPHLQNAGQIRLFLQQARQALKPGGYLVLQIINFTRVLIKNIHHFPAVETEAILFERTYSDISPEKLTFTIHIHDKLSSTDDIASTFLYPVTASELRGLLEQCGFGTVVLHANYACEPVTAASTHFLVVAGQEQQLV